MIDLSHLTEEEQEMIMVVLNRDSELKKSEEQRIKQLQQEVPEEDRRKYMTGEWFYEVKSQRHQDRIHGSDIIMASMKKQRFTVDAATALADYLTRSWGKSSFNKKNSDDISEQPMERVNQGGTPEVQEEGLNRCMRSPSKPRHNPFNNIPVELDFEETGSLFTSESGLRRSSADIGFDSEVKHQEPSHAENNREFSNIVPNITPRQKPVPMKRTKILKPQGSLSDSASSVSSQSVSTQSISTPSTSTKSVSVQSVTTTEDSGIRTPAPRGILKNSSSESTLKSQLPQPILSHVHQNNDQEKDSEERKHILESKEEPSRRSVSKEPPKCPSLSKVPKSRLPVRSQSQMSNLSQATQETEKIQKHPSLNSIQRVDDDKKGEDSLKQQRNTYNCLPRSSNIEQGDQKISDEIMETFQFPHENAGTTNTIQALDVMTATQPTQQRSETVESHMTVLPNVQMTRAEEHLGTAVDQQFPSSLNIADTSEKANASIDREPESRPSAFNIKLKTNNSLESQPAVVTDSNIHTPSAEHGKSITKVLEWFSRSSDSSDMLDVESNQDMEEETKIDDIDLEDAANLRIKTRDNVYLIMPRQSEESPSELNSTFLQETPWGQEKSIEELRQTTPKQRRRSKSTSHKQSPNMNPSTNFTFTDIPDTVTEPEDNVFWTPDENEKDCFIKHNTREEPKVKLETNVIQVHQPKERTGDKENQRPKLATLKSFWEKENTGPKILISRSNASAKNEPLTLDVSTESIKGGNDQRKDELEKSLRERSPDHQRKETVSVVEVSDLKDAVSTNTIQSVPIVTGDSEVSQSIYSNQKKDQRLSSSSTDKCATSVPRLKSSSASLDSGSLLAHQDIESVGGTVSINSSNGDCTAPKELETKSTTAPRPNPLPRAKQQENMVNKIKQLKSFWENEKSTSAQKSKSSMASTAKLNKRFTKSEFDLSTVGTEFDDVFEDDTNDKGSLSPGFSMHTPQKEKPPVIDRMSTSQFKNLRDFWGGSPENQKGQTSPVLKSGFQRTFGQPTKHSKPVDTPKETNSFIDATSHAQVKTYNKQSERSIPVKLLVNESQTNNKQAALNASAKRRKESGSKSSSSNVDSDEANSHGVSHTAQTSMKDITPSKPSTAQESQPQHRRSRGKASLNGKANSMRRATSMFSINTEVEEQSQDSYLQSKTSQSPNLHQVKNTTESNLVPSKKTRESSHTQPKTPPEYSWQDKEGNIQSRQSRTSEETEVQPLARSFIPPDYQHYLGITEKSPMYTPPSVTGQMDQDDFLCTSFTTSTDTSSRCKCSPVRTSTPVPGSPDLQTRRGSLGQTDGHVCHNASHISAPDTPSHTKGNINCDESLVQKALRRASTRPVYHKSMDNISTSPGQGQNKHMDDFEQVPSTYVTTSFTTSDSEHLKQLSKSVPSFLQKESDEEESDSENSSRSGIPQINNRQYTNLNYSGFASMSSVSGSVASVYSSDYGSVEVQGIIQFSLNYVQKLREFHIFVIQCQNLAAVDVKKNRSDPYVKSYLIPDLANLGKRKTSVKKKTLNPTYNEILRYRVRKDYLKSQVLNLSVWHHDTFGRNSFLGETEFDLSFWDFNDTERKFLPLKPRSRSGQSLTSLQPSDLRGQMRLAVRFLPQISQSKFIPGTGEVHIWVKDCKNLPLIRSPSIDPYVKCFVLPDTSKKSRQKTRVLKKTTSPMFNHTMVYDGFRAEDLKEACIELTVWDRDRLANHLLGGLRLGTGTGKSYGALVSWMDSTPEEVDLWRRMMESPNEWVEDILPLRMLATDKKSWK